MYSLQLQRKERAYLLKLLRRTLNNYELIITKTRSTYATKDEVEQDAEHAFNIHKRLTRAKEAN